MRTIRIKAYKFEKLSEDAKQAAIHNYRIKGHNDGNFDEIKESVKAVCNVFNLKTGREWSDLNTDSIEDQILELKGLRLVKYIWNNYKRDIFKGKYYGKLVKTEKDGTAIIVSKEHPAGMRHVKRYSKVFLDNSCVLTGVCYDMDILDPIYNFLEKPDADTTFADLIQEMESAISKTFRDEEEWINSDEYISEMLEANDYEFTKDGKSI